MLIGIYTFQHIPVPIGNSSPQFFATGAAPVLIVVVSLLTALGVAPRPLHSFVAVTGYLAAILLGIGVGIISVAILGFFPGWLVGYALFDIVMYLASGIIAMPSFLPEKIYYWLKFNPALPPAERIRSAYYPSVGLKVDSLDVVMFGMTCLSLCLLMVKHIISKQS